MANSKNAGSERSRNDQRNDQENQGKMKQNTGHDQDRQDVQNLRNQGAERTTDNQSDRTELQGQKQSTSNQSGAGSAATGKTGINKDRSSSGLKSTTLDSSSQSMRGQEHTDNSGREEGNSR